jgi:hypothetical protein
MFQIERVKDSGDRDTIFFDLSSLEFTDPEGMAYILLLPFRIQYMSKNIQIILPQSEDVLSFMIYTDLLNLLCKKFTIVGGYTCVEDILTHRHIKEYSKKHRIAKVSLIEMESFDRFFKYEIDQLERTIAQHSYTAYSSYFSMCFYELSKNVFEHSGQSTGAFSYHLKNGRGQSQLMLSISDIGIGIKNSLGGKMDFSTNKPDSFYIEKAIEEGISSTNDAGRGLGLYNVVSFSSKVKLISGKGLLRLEDGSVIEKKDARKDILGTSVVVEVDI